MQPKGWRDAKEHSSCVNLSRKLAFFAHFTRASLIIEYVPPLSLLDRRTPLNFRTSFLCSLRFCSRFSLYRRFDYDKIGWSNSNSKRKASKYEDMKSVDLGACNPLLPCCHSFCVRFPATDDDNFIPSVSPSRDFALHLCNPIECLQTKEITNNGFLLHKS